MTLAKHWKYGKDEDIVVTQLRGLVASNPYVNLIPSEKVVFNPHSDTSKKITIISGGGAGHEPMHGGFVGENLLDAAVSGSVFASPSTKQIMAAIKTKSNKEKGTIIVIKNYTGDILHFGLVAERAKSEGYKVELVIVSDDVAVGREQNKMVGRRGLAGTAFIHKIWVSLVLLNLVTLGASLDRTSVPGKLEEEIEFTGNDEMELGLGIHNEPGTKIKPIPNIDELIQKMYHQLLSPEDKDRHYVDFDFENDEYKPKRVYVSDFVTSFNSPGFSITLLNLSNLKKEDISFTDEDVLKFLDTPTNAPGWKPKIYDSEIWDSQNKEIESPMKNETLTSSDLKIDGQKFESQLVNALKVLLDEEPKITRYDTVVGDGDCGQTLADGANSILKALKEDDDFKSNLNDPVYTLGKITEYVEDSMGGTSGGLYSIFLTALVKQLKQTKEISVQSVGDALYHALYDGLFKYTRARVGGRTLIDTLQPFVDALHKTGDLTKAVEAANKGCEETKNLHASFGRASYVNEEEFKAEGGIPDPGAVGVLALIKGFTEKL
ncbi:Dak1 domain family protein [Candida albicans]|uniref:Dak1 domain family protein n=1 Tax=Candida albicans TaxID=5476 RepID=A0A8H6F235_CANAX|nr:Dak1 domain family protein [Candida albicans]